MSEKKRKLEKDDEEIEENMSERQSVKKQRVTVFADKDWEVDFVGKVDRKLNERKNSEKKR